MKIVALIDYFQEKSDRIALTDYFLWSPVMQAIEVPN